jgi:FPC/CPF motif-containing protein YcgG
MSSRFALGLPLAERFEAIAAASACPFARLGTHVAGPEWLTDVAVVDNAARVAADLAALLATGRADWDGYVVEIAERAAPSSVAALGDLLRELLTALSTMDPSGKNCMALPVETKGWWFRFGSRRFFVLTLSSLYSVDHSRSTLGVPGTFVLFQPEHAFDNALRKLGAVTPRVRSNVRKAFATQGRSYDASLSESPYEVHRYVKPLERGAPVVRWWTAD